MAFIRTHSLQFEFTSVWLNPILLLFAVRCSAARSRRVDNEEMHNDDDEDDSILIKPRRLNATQLDAVWCVYVIIYQ